MTDTYTRIAAKRITTKDTEEDLYALTSGSMVGTVYWTNRASSSLTYRLALTDAGTGVSAATEDWLAYDTEIQGNMTHQVHIRGMAATSTLRMQANSIDLNAVFTGLTIT